MPSTLGRINFKRTITILAAVFIIALGMCGLNFLASRGGNISGGVAGILIVTGLLEVAAILLSALGLFFVSILWLSAKVFGKKREADPGPQRHSDDSNGNSDAGGRDEENHD